MQQLVKALENAHQERDDMAVWGDWAQSQGRGNPTLQNRIQNLATRDGAPALSYSPIFYSLSFVTDMSTDIWKSNGFWYQTQFGLRQKPTALVSRKKMLDVGLLQGSLLMLLAGCPAMAYKPRGVSPASSTIATW